jgi:crossover junction endodeoxyribonuclease RusA
MRVSFVVEGTPIPQGSMSAFVPKGWTRAIVTSANPKLKLWRATVNVAAQSAMRVQCQDRAEKGVPLKLSIQFVFRQPKSNRDEAKTTKPDVDKLVRSIFDSLSGIVYADDAQVVMVAAWKRFGLPERVEIYAESLENKEERLLWQQLQ